MEGNSCGLNKDYPDDLLSVYVRVRPTSIIKLIKAFCLRILVWWKLVQINVHT